MVLFSLLYIFSHPVYPEEAVYGYEILHSAQRNKNSNVHEEEEKIWAPVFPFIYATLWRCKRMQRIVLLGLMGRKVTRFTCILTMGARIPIGASRNYLLIFVVELVFVYKKDSTSI